MRQVSREQLWAEYTVSIEVVNYSEEPDYPGRYEVKAVSKATGQVYWLEGMDRELQRPNEEYYEFLRSQGERVVLAVILLKDEAACQEWHQATSVTVGVPGEKCKYWDARHEGLMQGGPFGLDEVVNV